MMPQVEGSAVELRGRTCECCPEARANVDNMQCRGPGTFCALALLCSGIGCACSRAWRGQGHAPACGCPSRAMGRAQFAVSALKRSIRGILATLAMGLKDKRALGLFLDFACEHILNLLQYRMARRSFLSLMDTLKFWGMSRRQEMKLVALFQRMDDLVRARRSRLLRRIRRGHERWSQSPFLQFLRRPIGVHR